MESSEDQLDDCPQEKEESSGSGSLSGSFGSSQSSASEFRRQMKPPNKKKYDEEMDELMKQIRTKEAELRSVGAVSQESTASEIQSFKGQREVAIGKRKKLENDLRTINQEITRKMGLLSRTESNLHYKNEAKIDDAIRNMEWQLKSQNFSLKEERKIVAEIDKMKRSKKTLQEYFTQKKEVDKLRDNQRRTRAEKDHLYKIITNLKSSEEEMKKSSQEKRARSEILRKDLQELHDKKRQMIAEFKQQEADFQRMLKEKRNNQRKESFRRKEEDRRAKEEAWKKERMEYELQREPFEDEKNLCNTLISYLQRFSTSEQKEDAALLLSPRDEQPETQIGDRPYGPADSLDDGMLILLKKSQNDDMEYSVTSKRPQRRSRKGRKLSVTKPLAHTPQILAQFSSLTLNAPSNMSEVAISIEQLQARKRYYEEQALSMPPPLLGSLNSSFSSSGSMSSLDSPLWDRPWSHVEIPPPIAENQTHSDAGMSGESGFHDMSRQVSKTESSESTADVSTDRFLEEIIQHSENSDNGDGQHSRSSSDTITPEDHLTGEVDAAKSTKEETADQNVSMETGQGNADNMSDYQSNPSHDNDSNSSLVFEDQGEPSSDSLSTSVRESKLRGNHSGSKVIGKPELVDMIANYDSEFPPALGGFHSDKNANSKTSFNAATCDDNKKSDTSLQTSLSVLVGDSEPSSTSPISIVIDSYDEALGARNERSQENVPEALDKTQTAKSGNSKLCGENISDEVKNLSLSLNETSLECKSSEEFTSLEDNVTHF